MIKIFGKQRESLNIVRIKAARALFMHAETRSDIEVRVQTDEGHLLSLYLPPELAHALVTEVATAYDAICPPLNRGGYAAQWNGMSD